MKNSNDENKEPGDLVIDLTSEENQTPEKPKKKYKKRIEMPKTDTAFNYQTPCQGYERKLMFEDKDLPPGWFRRLYYRQSGQRTVFSTLIFIWPSH